MIPQADKRPHTFDRAMGAELADMARKNRGALTDPHADPQVAAWENADIRFCLTPPDGIPGAVSDGTCKIPLQFPGAECAIYFGDWGSDSPQSRNVVAANPPTEWVYNCGLCPIPSDTFLPVWRSNDGTLFVFYRRDERRMLRAYTCIQPGTTDGLAYPQRQGTNGWEKDPAYPSPVKVNNLDCLLFALPGELFPAQSQGCCQPGGDPSGFCATLPYCPPGSHNYWKIGLSGGPEYAGCWADDAFPPPDPFWNQCPASGEESPSDCKCQWLPTAEHGLTRRVRVDTCIACGKTGTATVLTTDCGTGGSGSGGDDCSESDAVCSTITVCNQSGRPIAPCGPENAKATLDPGTCCWYLEAGPYPTRAKATMKENACPGDEDKEIEDVTFPNFCGDNWTVPTKANSPYLAACKGKKVEMVPTFTCDECKWEIVVAEQVPLGQTVNDLQISCKSTTCVIEKKTNPAVYVNACTDAACAGTPSGWTPIEGGTGELVTFVTAVDCTGGSGSGDCGTGSFATKTGCVFCTIGAGTLPGITTQKITYVDSFTPSVGSGSGGACGVVANLKSACVLVCGTPTDAGTVEVFTGTWQLFAVGIYDAGCLSQTQVSACVLGVGTESSGAVPGVTCSEDCPPGSGS